MWATPSSTLSHLRPSLGSVAFFLGRDFYVQQIALCSFQGWHVQFVGFQLDCFFLGGFGYMTCVSYTVFIHACHVTYRRGFHKRSAAKLSLIMFKHPSGGNKVHDGVCPPCLQASFEPENRPGLFSSCAGLYREYSAFFEPCSGTLQKQPVPAHCDPQWGTHGHFRCSSLAVLHSGQGRDTEGSCSCEHGLEQ